MPGSVLLARPHPFIKDRMVPFLESAGMAVKRTGSPEELAAVSQRPAGAVISLAVTSDVAASAADVALMVRERWPDLPLLFAALLSPAMADNALTRLAAGLGLAGHRMLTPDDSGQEGLGRDFPGHFLYINHEHLADSTVADRAMRLVQKHFR